MKGQEILDLLKPGLDRAAAALNRITRQAVERVGLNHLLTSSRLYNEAEADQLWRAAMGCWATGELIGRAIPRARMLGRRVKRFAEPIQFPNTLLQPVKALEYFEALVPSLNLEPRNWQADLERSAFTMVAATTQQVLERVRGIVIDGLKEGTPAGAQEIRQVLDRAGMLPSNPQYSEMVYRTNVLDAHAAGHDREMQDPEMREFFPAWLYSATIDQNSRPWHRKKNNRMYPQAVPFVLVRGTAAADVCNCRCVPIDLDRWDVEDRLAKGERLYTGVTR